MKKISLFVALIVLFSFLTFSGAGVFAQNTELPDPGLLPDSPFYFLEIISEDIVSLFTFGDLKKAERYAKLATERLAEVQAIAEKEKPKLIEKTLARYEKQLENSIARAEKAQAKDKNTEKVMEVVARVGQATSKHLQVLAEVGEKCPEQAKSAIENAMKVSLKGHTRAVLVLREKNALGDVPQQVSLPENIPQDVRERIQTNVQEELVEEFLQGSESPRDLCVKTGGPPEACEKIPVDGFESFDALKAFFVEVGAPEEMWEVAKSKCEELGATTPDKCFRLLLVSTSTAYVSTAPSVQLQQERDPDCPHGHITYGTTKYCCEDSDRSSSFSDRHYYMRGTIECKVFNTVDGALISHETNTDSCDGDRLTEWMCDENLKASFEEYDCPKGCVNGACKGLREIMEAEEMKGAEIRTPEEIRSPSDAEPSGSPEGMRSEQGGITIEHQSVYIAPQSAYIGVLFTLINDNMQTTRNLSVNYGALVRSIVPDTPAARAGIKKDDIILEFDNRRITEDNSLTEMLYRSKAGTTAVLKVLRDGDTLIINVGLVGTPID